MGAMSQSERERADTRKHAGASTRWQQLRECEAAKRETARCRLSSEERARCVWSE